MRPGRLQYRPLSLPVTFLYSAWWECGFVEFSVWRSYKRDTKTKRNTPEPWKFRVNIGHGRLLLDMYKSR